MPPDGVLIGLPNSLRRADTRRLLVYGYLLALCGFVSVFNAAIAEALQAHKHITMLYYVNTHWITTVFCLAGVAVLLTDRFKTNTFLLLSCSLCVISLTVAVGAICADVGNIVTVANENTTADLRMFRSSSSFAMQVYAVLDAIVCAVAALLAGLTLRKLRELVARYLTPTDELQVWPLLVCGLLLATVGFVKSVLWAMELHWLHSLGDRARYLFIHYTMDEPVWNCLYMLTGALNLFAAMRGCRVVGYSAFALTALSAYPAVFYMWQDYRWYTNVHTATFAVEKPPHILEANIVFTLFHLLLILFTCVVYMHLIAKSHNPPFYLQLNTEPTFRRAFSYAAFLFLFGCVGFLLSDAANIVAQSFYRQFYASEQKLPFYMLATGALCLLTLRSSLALYLIPITFTMLLMTAHQCVFPVVAFFYLSYQIYFEGDICDLFGMELNCRLKPEELGAWAHFFEAAMSASVLILSIYLAYILSRIMKMFYLRLGALDLRQMQRKRALESWLLIVGAVGAAFGVVVVVVSVKSDETLVAAGHPIAVLYSVVLRSSGALALVVYPAVQAAFARDALHYPMRAITLVVVALVRLTELLGQLDQGNYGAASSTATTLVHLVQLLSVGGFFASLCMCLAVIDIALQQQPQLCLGDPVEPSSQANTADANDAPTFHFKSIADGAQQIV